MHFVSKYIYYPCCQQVVLIDPLLLWFPCVHHQSLCNACGIRYKKEERRAAAAAVAPANLAADGGVEYASSYGYARQPQQWGCYGPAAVAKAASFGMFGDAAGGEVDACLPWGRGVMPSSSPAFGAVREMPSLFQYY
jgi:hypothetical protein